MTPRQARAARAMLSLDLKAAVSLIGIGKRTLTEYEAGIRTLNNVTAAKIEGFYRSQGIVFGSIGSTDEAVSFQTQSEVSLEPDSIRPKIETANVINSHYANCLLDEMGRQLSNLREAARVSQNVMRSIVVDANFERTDVASRLGVTPSFISAILLGQKLLPTSHAEEICRILRVEYDLKEALLGERRLKKVLQTVTSLLAEAGTEVDRISSCPKAFS